MNFTLRQLTHASALLEHRSFREAALALNLTQPALTRSIQALEESLGVTLFDRLAHGVEATHAGASLLRQAAVVLRESAFLENEARLLLGLETGSLTVATGAFPEFDIVPRAVAGCVERAPGVRIRILRGNWRDAVERVLEREADMGIAEITEVTHDSRIEVDFLGEQALYFVCRREHPLAAMGAAGIDDILAFPVAAPVAPLRISALFAGHPAAGRVDVATGNFHPAIEVANVDTAVRIVLGSDAITVAPLSSVEPLLESGALVALGYEHEAFHARFGAFHLRGRTPSPLAAAFAGQLQAHMDKVVECERRLRSRYLPPSTGARAPREVRKRLNRGSA